MNFWGYTIAAVVASVVLTPIDRKLAKRNTRLWKRYVLAFVIGLPLIWGVNLLVEAVVTR